MKENAQALTPGWLSSKPARPEVFQCFGWSRRTQQVLRRKIQLFKRQEMGNTKRLSDTLIRDNTALNLSIEFIENQLEHLKKLRLDANGKRLMYWQYYQDKGTVRGFVQQVWRSLEKLKKRVYFAVEVVGKEISHSFGRYLEKEGYFHSIRAERDWCSSPTVQKYWGEAKNRDWCPGGVWGGLDRHSL